MPKELAFQLLNQAKGKIRRQLREEEKAELISDRHKEFKVKRWCDQGTVQTQVSYDETGAQLKCA